MPCAKDGTLTFENKPDVDIGSTNSLKATTRWDILNSLTEFNECSGFKKDDKVIVRCNNIYYKRHFAECIEGRACCYNYGCSSFTADSEGGHFYLGRPQTIEVDFCVEATAENIKKYFGE